MLVIVDHDASLPCARKAAASESLSTPRAASPHGYGARAVPWQHRRSGGRERPPSQVSRQSTRHASRRRAREQFRRAQVAGDERHDGVPEVD